MPQKFISHKNASSDTKSTICPGCKKLRHPQAYKKRTCVQNDVVGYKRDIICQNCPSKVSVSEAPKRPSVIKLDGQINSIQADFLYFKDDMVSTIKRMASNIMALNDRIAVLESKLIQSESLPSKTISSPESIDPSQ